MDRVLDVLDSRTRFHRAWLLLPLASGGLEVVGYALADRRRAEQRMAALDWRRDLLLTRLLTTTEMLVIEDMRSSPLADQAQVQYFGNRTLVAVPMLQVGERVGALCVGTFAPEPVTIPTPDELAIVEELGAIVTVVVGRLRAEAAARALRDETHRGQSLAALGRMAGGVAHDLNNMLVPILGNAEIALAARCSPQLERLLLEIVESAKRAAALTRQLLAFSRGAPVECSAIELGGLLRRSLPLLRAAVPAAIRLELEVRGTPPTVLANAGQLEQVVTNLVLNARDAIEGQGTIVLELGSEEQEGERWAVLRVTDSGRGMSEDLLARVFEPFFSTKSPGAGTGLGLAVVDSVVRSCGGRIDVASRPGAGASFTLRFPATSSKSRDTPPPALPLRGGRGESILVVDDDPGVRVVIERILVTAGYRVALAASTEEAMRTLEASRFALIVSDLVLPGRSGEDLLRSVATRAGAPAVLLTTGYCDDSRALRTTAPLLLKPFARDELLRKVREQLDRAAPTAAEPPVASPGDLG